MGWALNGHRASSLAVNAISKAGIVFGALAPPNSPFTACWRSYIAYIHIDDTHTTGLDSSVETGNDYRGCSLLTDSVGRKQLPVQLIFVFPISRLTISLNVASETDFDVYYVLV